MEVRNWDYAVPLVEQHSSDVIAREMAELHLKIDSLAFLTILEHCLDHLAELLGSRSSECLKALRSEKLHGADFTHMTPIVAVRCPHDVSVVVAENLSSYGRRSTSPNLVLHLHKLSCSLRR
jgi:hypothetical protein